MTMRQNGAIVVSRRELRASKNRRFSGSSLLPLNRGSSHTNGVEMKQRNGIPTNLQWVNRDTRSTSSLFDKSLTLTTPRSEVLNDLRSITAIARAAIASQKAQKPYQQVLKLQEITHKICEFLLRNRGVLLTLKVHSHIARVLTALELCLSIAEHARHREKNLARRKTLDALTDSMRFEIGVAKDLRIMSDDELYQRRLFRKADVMHRLESVEAFR